MKKLKAGDLIKSVRTGEQIYKIVQFQDENFLYAEPVPKDGSGLIKLKIGTCHKTQLNGEIFTLPKVETMRNRNPKGFKVSDMVILKGVPNELYVITKANTTSCWIENTSDASIVKKDVNYYSLEDANQYKEAKKKERKQQRREQAVNSHRERQRETTKNPDDMKMINNVPKQTGTVIIVLKGGKVIDVPLMDHDDIESIEVEKLVTKSVQYCGF